MKRLTSYGLCLTVFLIVLAGCGLNVQEGKETKIDTVSENTSDTEAE